ncbi:MAG: sporulation protein YqfD [Clostridia bacterium]|nr:sporulation protein YqfD [Clostridia bacterium]
MKGLKRFVTVEGLNLERFFRMTAEQGVACLKARRRGRRCTFLIDESRLPVLVAIAVQGGWQITQGSRCGAGRHYDRVRRHWLLGGLLCVMVIGILLMTQMLWSVSLINAGSYVSDARIFLRHTGIQAPMMKSSVDLNELREQLEWRYPDVAWIECGWRGTALRITFVQGISSKDEHLCTSARDVVSAESGIVECVITLAGTPVVSSGDLVTAGQTLIQGYERGADEQNIPVSARGIVKLRVWDSASAKVSLYETNTIYTGNSEKNIRIEGPFFALYNPDKPTYEHFDIKRGSMPLGGLFFPFMLHVDEYRECRAERTIRSIEQVKREAEEAAMRILREKTGFDDDFVDKWVDYCMIEDEEVCAIVYGERIVDAASYD